MVHILFNLSEAVLVFAAVNIMHSAGALDRIWAAPITSGDTALRSARLIAADFMGMEQKTIVKRLMISIPIFLLCFVIMLMPYDALWRYFAWCNQVLSVFTLWTITVWLARHHKMYVITLLPAMFMTCVTVTYIFFAPEGFGAITEPLTGYRFSYGLSLGIGLSATAFLTWLFSRWYSGMKSANPTLTAA